MRKKKILIIIFSIIPLLVSSCFGLWIILKSTIFAPVYVNDSKNILFELYNNQAPATYDGTKKGPTSADKSKVDDKDVEFYYRLSTSKSFYKKGLPINANDVPYDILIKHKSYSDTVVQYTINKATPNIVIDPTFTSIFEGELDNNYIPAVLENGKATFNDSDLSGTFTFKEITSYSERSGIKYFYDVNGTTDANGYIAPVTYTFNPTDTTNFKTITRTGFGKITIKPIAFSDSTYYGSIEHALDKVTTGTINVIAEVSEGKRRIRSSCAVASGVVLQFLYGSSTTIIKDQTNYYPNETKSSDRTYALDKTTYRKNLVYLDSEVVMTNNGKIIIGGIISSGAGGNGPNCQTCADYAEIIMGSNSQLVNNDNSYLISYGSIKDESISSYGNVIINNRATMQMPFIVIEHRGGSIFSGVYKNLKGAAFNRFFFQNISSKLTFNAGGVFFGYANLYASSHDNETRINVVGSSSSFLIDLQNEAYFEANYDNITRINKIDFYGDMSLNSLDMEVVGQSVSTKAVYFPLSWYFDITTDKLPTSNNKAQVVFNQDIKLLPGSRLRIGENVEAIAKKIIVYNTFSDVNVGCADLYQNSKKNLDNGRLYVNGKLTILDSGAIAGLIETEVDGAQLVVSPNASTSATSYELAGSSGSGFLTTVTWSEYIRSFTIYPYTVSGTSTEAISGASGTMYSRNGGWYATTMSINYEPLGGTSVPSKTILNIDSKGYIVTNADLPVISKNHYSFDGWYLDDTYSQEAVESTTLYCSVTLYAKWTPIEYNISYIDKYSDNSNPGNISTNNNPSTFNIETVRSLSEAVNGNYVFGGWFIDEECTIKISMLKGQELLERLLDGNLNIYALWYPQGSNKYVITFENDSNDVTCEETFTQVITSSYDWSTYELPIMTGKDDDYTVSKYFGGWYNGDLLVETITDDMFVNIDGTNRLTLKAKWLDKNTLTILIPLSTIPLEFDVYYKSGKLFTIPSLEDRGITLKHNVETDSGEVLIHWKDNNGNIYTPNSQMTLTNQTTLTANIKKYIKLVIGTNDYTKATVILTKGEGYKVIVEDNIPTFNSFNNEEYSNGASIYITVGSIIKASYSVISGESNGATMKIVVNNSQNTTDFKLETTGKDYEIKEDYKSISINLAGSGGCVVEGTLITLADGTKKKVEDLTLNDKLLIWNMYTGKFESAPILFIYSDQSMLYEVINLYFSDGTTVGVISDHGFFDYNEGKYVYLDRNASNYIGHWFNKQTTDDLGNMINSKVQLVDVVIEKQYTTAWSPVTYQHLCYYVNGMLSMPGGIYGMFNFFEVDTNTLVIDYKQMQEDISTYGLFTYEEFNNLVPLNEIMFEVFNGKYLKIAIGKGLIDYDTLIRLVESYSIYFK